ncbi:MAG: IPT/TIG domain-containing protein, partial [Myxococcota bacterium]
MRALATLAGLTALLLAQAPAAAQRRGGGGARPVVEQIRPRSGPVGSELVVVGRNMRGSRFFLGGVPMEVRRCTVNRCTLIVPAGARTGAITLESGGQRYDGPRFRVTAGSQTLRADQVVPTSANAGDTVRILGTGFRSAAPLRVSYGGRAVAVQRATDGEIVVTAPAQAGSDVFTIEAGNLRAQTPAFEVRGGMRIESVDPPYAPEGGRWTIHGRGFPRGDRRAIRVRLGAQELRVLRVNPQRLVVRVPRIAQGRQLEVRAFGQRAVFDLRGAGPVRLTRAVPAAGHVGEQITLEGQGFGNVLRNVRVSLGERSLAVVSVSPTQIVARLPRRPPRGAAARLSVEVAGVASEAIAIEFLDDLRIARHSPLRGDVGTEVVISGRGFATARRLNRVRIGGIEQEIIDVRPNQLRIRVVGGSGALEVMSGGALARSPQPFVLQRRLAITSITPLQASVGDDVTVSGSGFGDRPRAVRAFI